MRKLNRMTQKLKWLLIPLSPVAMIVGFIIGIVRGSDKRIAFYCDGEHVTLGEIRQWGAKTTEDGRPWEPKTRQ